MRQSCTEQVGFAQAKHLYLEIVLFPQIQCKCITYVHLELLKLYVDQHIPCVRQILQENVQLIGVDSLGELVAHRRHLEREKNRMKKIAPFFTKQYV